MNTGQVCKIHRLVELKHKYKLRLFIDESVSFGSLGQHGKGITEHAGISVCGTCEKIIPGLLFKKVPAIAHPSLMYIIIIDG